jgi:hypothetical protein
MPRTSQKSDNSLLPSHLGSKHKFVLNEYLFHLFSESRGFALPNWVEGSDFFKFLKVVPNLFIHICPEE